MSAGRDASDVQETLTASLEDAISATKVAITYWDNLPPGKRDSGPYKAIGHKAVSNAVYYLSYLIKKGGANGEKKELLRVMVNRLSSYQVPNDYGSYKSYDNIMHGMVALNESNNAVDVAKHLYDDLKRQAQQRAGKALELLEIPKYLNKDQWEVFTKTINVLASDGAKWD